MAIPLDPGAGGMSIDQRALHISDIIVSTVGSSMVSRAIRVGTLSPVSHALLYIGYGQVVEAIGEGVVLRTLTESVKEATLAVAYRHPDLDETGALKVRDFVGRQIGKKYNYAGIAQQTIFKACVLRGNIACAAIARTVTIKRDEFFCSQLIFSAYSEAGVKLSETSPNWAEPGSIPKLYMKGTLDYVGHIKA